MKAYQAILKALLRRLGWLALVLWGFPVGILVLVLAGIPWGIWHPAPLLEIGRGAILIALMLFPIVMWFIGLLLAQATMSLPLAAHVVLLPSYRRRVVADSAVLGFALWATVLPSFALQGLVANKDALWFHWAPLCAYGVLGLGFIGGICASNAQNANSSGLALWQRWMWVAPMLATMWLPITLTHAPLWQWMTTPWLSDWVVFTPLGVLCLLVGPLTWRGIAALWMVRAQVPSSPVVRDVQTLTRSGNSWGLASGVRWLHTKHSVRPEFLLFQPNLLSLVTLPLRYLVVFFGLLAPLTVADQLLSTTPASLPALIEVCGMVLVPFFLALPLTPALGSNLDLPRLGQCLLLPGIAFNRYTMPHQILSRMLAVWLIGAGFTMLPVAAYAVWAGASAKSVVLTTGLLVWGICTATAIAFFRQPRKATKAAGDPLETLVGFVLLGTVPCVHAFGIDALPFATACTAIVVGFLIPLALSLVGLHRWQNMSYSA